MKNKIIKLIFIIGFGLSGVSLPLISTADSCRDLSDPVCRADLEPKCKLVTEQMLSYIENTPASEIKSHRERHAEILFSVKKVVSEGRSRGESECDILGKVQKIVVNQ